MSFAWVTDNLLARTVAKLWRRRLIRNAGFLLAAQYAGLAAGIVTATVAARMLGPNRYGLAAIVMAYPTLVRGLVARKSDLVTTRYISGLRATRQYPELLGICKLGFGIDLLISLTTVLLVWLTAQRFAGEALRASNLTWLMVAFAATFPFQSLRKTGSSVLASWQLFNWIAGFQFAERFLTLILVVVLIKAAGLGVAGLVLGTGLASALVGVGMLVQATNVLAREHVGLWWTGSVRGIRHIWKELAAFFGWNQLATAVSAAAGQLPVLLLGYFWGAAAAGLFRLASTLVTAGGYLDDIFKDVVYPDLSARWEAGARSGLIVTLKRWSATLGVVAAALPLLLIPLLPTIVRIGLKRGFMPVVSGAQLMLLGEAVSSLVFWVRPLYYGMALPKLWAAGFSLYQGLMLAALSLAAWRFGFNGVAAASAVGVMAFNLIMAWRVLERLERLAPRLESREAASPS